MDYSTIQQHQPLRVPSSFDKQGRALIVQLDEIFDDIYKRFGRLKVSDLGGTLKNLLLIEDETGKLVSVSSTIDGLRTDIHDEFGNYYTKSETASQISSSISTALGDYSTTQQTAAAISAAVANCYGKQSNIDISAEGIELSGGTYVQIKTQNDENIVRLDETGITMETEGKVYIHAKDDTASAIIFGTDVEDSSFSVDLDGDLYSKSLTTESLVVAGNEIPGVAVSDSQPSGHNVLWLKPSSTSGKQWNYTPSTKGINISGGTLTTYRDFTIPYAASDYLAGNLYYGIRVRLYVYISGMSTVVSGKLKARLKNGSSWIDLGQTANKTFYANGYLTIDTTLSTTNDNVMSASGGSFTVRIETSVPSGNCRLADDGIILRAKSTSTANASVCTVYYIS